MSNRLTVVITTYNRSKYLLQTINSVLNQTFQDFDLIVLDNCSTDETYDMMQQFKNNNKVRYVRNNTNIGMVPNWNKAIEICNTEYISIFHDDDIMKPNMLEKEINILENDDNLIFVSSNADLIDEDGNLIHKSLANEKQSFFEKFEYIKKVDLKDTNVICPSVMLRNSFLKNNNIRFCENISIYADLDMWFRLNCFDKRMCILSEALMYYRTGSMQGSVNQADIMIEYFPKLYWRIKKFLSENNLNEYITKYKYLMSYLAADNILYKQNVLDDERLFEKYIKKLNESDFWLVDDNLAARINCYLKLNKIDLEFKFSDEHDFLNLCTAYSVSTINNYMKLIKAIEEPYQRFENENVAIFGTKYIGYIMNKFVEHKGASVKCFFDNNRKMQNKLIDKKVVLCPNMNNIVDNNIDTIIVCIESENSMNQVKKQVDDLGADKLKVYLWTSMIN